MMLLTRDRLFALLMAWTVVAGSLLSSGLALHIILLAVAGALMSAVCPWGVTAVWWLRRRRELR